MLKKLLGVVAIIVLLTGCGVQVKQDGNKIYTDISKDQAYSFTQTALKTKGYKITAESTANYSITAVPETNTTFQIERSAKKELSATIAKYNDQQTVVTVVAFVNGDIDAAESNRIAAAAVKEIITELDLYGAFTARKDGLLIYPVATLKRVQAYIQTYLTQNNLTIVKDNAAGLTVTEVTALNSFDQPLQADIAVARDAPDPKVTVTVKTTLQGNYDVLGNQAYVEKFTQRFLDYLDAYPAVEKAAQFTYAYIGFDKAFANAKGALTDAGCTLISQDPQHHVITAEKNNSNLVLTFANPDNALVISITAAAEGYVGETKAQLTARLSRELAAIQAALRAYQTLITAHKVFLTGTHGDVVKFIQTALKNLSYRNDYDQNAQLISAIKTTDAKRSHYLLVPETQGAAGITVEINTLYNGKDSAALAIAKREQAALLAALNVYDGQGEK